jgi:IS30 family transposase
MSNYTRITSRERRQINTFIHMGLSVAQMSHRLQRAPSTIYRELKRNALPSGHYLPGYAQELMYLRRPRKKRKIESDESLKTYVINGLRLGWSPEQIAGRLRIQGCEKSICFETIYRYIYRQTAERLYRLLPRRKPKRIKKHARLKHRKTLYMQLRNIKNRDHEAETRELCGHWEGDTIRFKRDQKSCVTTLVDRKSRTVLLAKNERGTSSIVMGNIQNLMKNFPRKIRRTITFDLGKEFMHFRSVEKEICRVYYCDPRKPWQRPSNENTNGRLRRYLPKDCNIDEIQQSTLDAIQRLMNNTPRKCLNFLTPYEVLGQYGKQACRTRT